MTREEINIPPGMMLEQQDAEAMYDFMSLLPQKGRMVEIGTGYGHSALFFSKVKPEWKIYTIDGFGLFGDGRIYDTYNKESVKKATGHYEAGSNIIQILGDSSKIAWELPADLIYLDGGHSYQDVKADFEKYSPFLQLNGFIFLHDYHRDDFGVRQLVDELCTQGWELLFARKVAIIRRKI